MALFKCKMCGGTLEINNNETVATCEYCGTQQTLPKLDDDRRANLYDRANHFRRNNEFDKDGRLFFKFCVNALLWYKIQNSNRVCEPQDGLHALFAS